MRLTRPIPQLVRLIPVVLAAAALPACNDDPTSNDTPYVVVPLTTATLAGTPGRTLAETLAVEVRTADGHPVPGATVQWSLPQGGSVAVVGAQLNGATSGTTDNEGRTYALWTLGLPEGTQQAQAAVGLGEPATFTAMATALHALSVSVGSDFACAILTDQRPVCWGSNSRGQLGTGDTLSSEIPVSPTGLSAVQEIVASATGHACARDMAGDVWCWGNNNFGEAGPAAGQPMQLVPVRVAGAEGASSIALGGETGYFSCAVLLAGGAKCWGLNNSGRLGTGDSPFAHPTPAPVVGSNTFVRIATTGDRACAETSARSIWCWGNGSAGELSPYPPGYYFTPIQPVPGYLFTSLALNYNANCGLGLNGEPSCWGLNGDLALGTVPPQPVTIAPVSPDVQAVFAQLVSDGSGLIMGRTRDGHLVYWGSICCDRNAFPTTLDLPIRAEQVAAGLFGYCMISESSGLYCDTDGLWFDAGKNRLKALPGT
jgi:alpha-tubulin suppressor-like RCC1 family protein